MDQKLGDQPTADRSDSGAAQTNGQDELPRPGSRAYPRLGNASVSYVGLPRDAWRDGYHVLLTLPTWAFLVVMGAAFLLANTVFGLLYMLNPGGVTNARPGNFQDAFFFSVQTMGTLGYGVMSPKSLYANLLATSETFVGLFNLGIATGLLFARISRPTARIMFSDRAVVSSQDGVPTLMFRAANQRRNLVVEAEISVTLVHDVVSAEGRLLRRFDEMPVVRSRTPLFFLSWQVMHPIDERSPLYGETTESLLRKRAEILVVLKGLDETFVSMIHARASYTPDEIVWGRPMADIFSVDESGRRTIDFRRFHDIE